jgi:membrane associated rhomboid family serine protease
VDRLLARLERRFGAYAPRGLIYVLVAAQLLGVMLGLTSPEKLEVLVFDRDLILAGEPWRIVSWLAMPPSLSPLWAFFALYWLYTMGNLLEGEWGPFKFFVYWLLGAVVTVTVAWLVGGAASATTLTLTLFLALATLWPDYQINIFMILPVKVKWLAYLAGAYLIKDIFSQPGFAKLIPVAGVANYLLFFGGTLIDRARGLGRKVGRAGAQASFRQTAAPAKTVRRCAICGASNDDPQVELRVCDCAKCGGAIRDLCLEHARNH